MVFRSRSSSPYDAGCLLNISGSRGAFTYRGSAEQIEESTQSSLLIRRHSNQFHTEFFLSRPADDRKVSGQGVSDEIDAYPYLVAFLHEHHAPDAASFQGHIDDQSASSPFAREHGRQHDGKPRALSFFHGTPPLDHVFNERSRGISSRPSMSGINLYPPESDLRPDRA